MVYRKLCPSRSFLLVFALVPILMVIIRYYSQFTSSNLSSIFDKKENFVIKILEINDREPTYKLATYEGYEFPLERNRAQTKLLNALQLQQKCQQNPNTTVIDIGASLGAFGLYAAACGCQVYMFEIEPKKVSLIEKSIKLNSFESRVHLIKKAVSDMKSNSTIYFDKDTHSQIASTSEIDIKDPDIFIGKTVNLNYYPFLSKIYIFRVDVQGHELHVFRATEKLFREHLVHHVIFEYTSWGTQSPIQKDIFNYMNQILGAKKFYALHPKEAIIYGPLNDQDINTFHSEHNKKRIQRDVYALFDGEQMNITARPYTFKTSFK